MRMRRSRSAAAVALAAAVLLLAAAGTALRGESAHAEQLAPVAGPAGWQGLLGGRTAPRLGGRQIVVLRAPSVAERARRAGGLATEAEMKGWAAAASAAQRVVLSRLAFRGAPVDPEYTYLRVLNGFAAPLDARAVALLERDPLVSGVYPVRAGYPAAVAPAASAADIAAA